MTTHKPITTLLVASLLGIAPLAGCGSSSPSAPSPTSTPKPSTPSNIAGAYNLTISASSTCSGNLPASARILRYAATISQSGSAWQTSLAGADIALARLTGTVSGSAVSINSVLISDLSNFFLPISVNGSAGTGSVGAGGEIVGTLNGQISVLTGGNCNAFDHQFRFTRR